MKNNNNIGFLLNPGPGDILRFMHGFCELSNDMQTHGIIYCLDTAWKTSKELIRHCACKTGKGIDAVLIGNIDDLHYKLRELDNDKIVFHAFESEYFIPGTKVFPSFFTKDLSCTLIQMDRFEKQVFMKNKFYDHLEPLPKLECYPDTGLIFIRDTLIVPERNITRDILSSILDCCHAFHFNYRFAGSSLTKHFSDMADNIRLELYPNEKYPDYYSQICEYSRYTFAIGMNSGALDLAAVSGIPTIRLGEFHHTNSHQGIDYNDAISSGFTINVLSNSERDISNITPHCIRDCFVSLSEHLKQNKQH